MLEGIVSDGKDVYWAATSCHLCVLRQWVRQPARQIASASSDGSTSGDSWNIGVNATSVYAGSPTDAFSCPTTGCTSARWRRAEQSLDGKRDGRGHRLDERVLAQLRRGSVVCARGVQRDPEPSHLARAVRRGCRTIAVDQANVYWNLGVASSFGPPDPTLAPGYAVTQPNGPSGYAEILRCAKGGCNGQPASIVKGLVAPMALATDGIKVYFTDLGIDRSTNTTNTGRVAKCPIAGCSDNGTTIADKLENPRGIGVDGTSIYWADFGSGALDMDSVCPSGSTSCPLTPLSVDGRIMVSPK